MSYVVHSVFDTFQGEGARAGERSVFVRLAGCNLWSGRPSGREKGDGACARWCDTDFATGVKMTSAELLASMVREWPLSQHAPGGGAWCVITGGEPGLQLDLPLVDDLHRADWRVAVETNGTQDTVALRSVDWLTLSPKLGGAVRFRGHVHELKVVLPGAIFPGRAWSDDDLLALERELRPDHRFVVPMDPPLSPATEDTLLHPRKVEASGTFTVRDGRSEFEANVKRCLDFCRAHPHWRIGGQLHKTWRVP